MTNTPKTTGPFKDISEKRNFVRRMFDDISGRYDLLNKVISLGMDAHWRRRTVKPHLTDKLILDICSGTGDMAKEIADMPGFEGFIVLGDFAQEMNKLAKAKLRGNDNVCFINCDAENLPFKPGVFEGVVNGYSLRNLGQVDGFGSEIERVLRPGGHASIIDMAHPPNRLLAWLFHIYYYKFTPWFSSLFTRNRYAYDYLPVSLKTFYEQPEVLEKLKAGKLEGSYENIFGGMIAIYRLNKSI